MYLCSVSCIICLLLPEPTVGPASINATALSAFEIQVSWEPVQQLSANGILRGYEVKSSIRVSDHKNVDSGLHNRNGIAKNSRTFRYGSF